MNAFVTEAFTLLGVGLAVIGLRLYVRVTLSGFKGLHADDYLMVFTPFPWLSREAESGRLPRQPPSNHEIGKMRLTILARS